MRILIFLLLALILPSTAFSEVPDAQDSACASSLVIGRRSAAQKAREIVAFMSLDHPVQHEAISKAQTLAEVFYWLHWSIGFEYPSEPRSYNPSAKGYNLDPKNIIPFMRRGTPPASVEEYMSRRRSHDRFVEHLIQKQWAESPLTLTHQIDDLMSKQVDLFIRYRSQSRWLELHTVSRKEFGDNIIAGIDFGLAAIQGRPRERQFLVEPSAAASLIRENLNEATKQVLSQMAASLKDPAVVLQLVNFFNEDYPLLINRRDDFRIERALSNLLSGSRLTLLKTHVLRDTKTRQRLREMQAYYFPSVDVVDATKPLSIPLELSSQVETPVTSEPTSLNDVLRQADNLPGHSDLQLDTLSVRDIIALGKIHEKIFSEAILILWQSRRSLNYAGMIEGIRQTKDSVKSDESEHLAAIIGELRSLENNIHTEAEILTRLQGVHDTVKHDLSQILSALNAQFKENQDVKVRELSQAEHLREVLMTMLPLGDLLEAREKNCQAKTDLVQTTLRNLYAMGMELAAKPVTDSQVRINEMLKPIFESVVP